MLKRPRSFFRQSRFVLGEGADDAECVRSLIDKRNLPLFDVSPNRDLVDAKGSSVAGNTGFVTAISQCEPITGFTNVRDVVVLSDNDENPDAAFASVCQQIEAARKGGFLKRVWGKAQKPGEKAAGDPSVSIWMWPSPGVRGCLETLLWQVMQATHPKEADCVKSACQCSESDLWPISKLHKAYVRAFIALACKKNPGTPLGLLWRDCPEFIDLMDAAFDPVSDFLLAVSKK